MRSYLSQVRHVAGLTRELSIILVGIMTRFGKPVIPAFWLEYFTKTLVVSARKLNKYTEHTSEKLTSCRRSVFWSCARRQCAARVFSVINDFELWVKAVKN